MKKLMMMVGALVLAGAGTVRAHDSWLEIATTIVRVKDVGHVNLYLGNHGNEHRDFKMAGKPSLEKGKLSLIGPDGKDADLKGAAIDCGLGEKEGYITAPINLNTAGLWVAAYTSDKVVTYAPLRSIHSAKAFVLASTSLDKPPADSKGFDRVLGHALEIVPQTNPVAPLSPGSKVKVQVMFQGKPLADARVSFVPRGATLAEGFDEKYERKTDASGMASYDVRDANVYLIAVHHKTEEKGEGYEGTKYSATLTVNVPAICACCGE